MVYSKVLITETVDNEVPNDWCMDELGQLLLFVGSGTTPKGGSKVYKTQGIPFIRSQNVYPQGLRIDDIVYISVDLHNSKMKRSQVKETDVLLNITGASIGRCTFVNKGFGKANVNQHVCILRTDETKLHYRYLSNVLQSNIGQKQIFDEQAGQTREGINYQQLRKFSILRPPLYEQKKIADILTSVDNTISKTEAIIEQTEKVKKGLMQQLLTKGIGHTKFKQTEIGEIPEMWKFKPLKELTVKIQDGTHFSPKTISRGYLYITSRNIRPFKFDLSNVHYISEEDHKQIYKRCDVKKGDILITKDGVNTGNALVNTIEDEFSLLSSVCFIRTGEYINSEFLCQYINSDICRNQISIQMTGNAIKRLTLTTINSFKVPVPSINEQIKISSILSKFDIKIDTEKKMLIRLQTLKKGLMQVLLTGKVRVKVGENVAVNT